MATVFNWLMILLGTLALAVLGFHKDNEFIIIPSLMFAGYFTAVLIDCILGEWSK